MCLQAAKRKHKPPFCHKVLKNYLNSCFRISLASMSSKQSENSRLSSRIISTSDAIDYDNIKISILTVEALSKCNVTNVWS